MSYQEFLSRKGQLSGNYGFKPSWMPDQLFDFQRHLVDWAVNRGRAAMFADCGLGKSAMQLVWAQNVVRHTNKSVLVLTPLAVTDQMVREAAKFGIEAARSPDGKLPLAKIVVTNYERLHYFSPHDFAGVSGDESSILKNCDGKTRLAVTEFMRTLPYRLLCTATAAPNDYIELGTTSEALGELGYQDMLGRFFKQTTTKDRLGWGRTKYKFRGHAVTDFWRWVASWSRACRKPSDLGFSDDRFVLPPLLTNEHCVKSRQVRPGRLFETSAENIQEEFEERRRTMPERCEKVATLVNHDRPAIAWCHLNPEGDLLAKLIPGSVQVSGSDSDERKEEVFTAFAAGQIRVLVTKPTIAGFGLNWQHCAHQTFFPSCSFEQYYQAVRRCWRFGQQHAVTVDIVTSEGEEGILANLNRKAQAAEEMFSNLVRLMNDGLVIQRTKEFQKKGLIPSWL